MDEESNRSAADPEASRQAAQAQAPRTRTTADSSGWTAHDMRALGSALAGFARERSRRQGGRRN